MNWSSRKKSTTVNAVTLLLCAVALGKVNTNIIEVYGQQLQQQQHQSNSSDSDIRRKLISFFSIKNHEDTDPTRKPTHVPTPHQAYQSDDYFNRGSYPTATVPSMPTPYGQPTDLPSPHPTPTNTPAPSRTTLPAPIPYEYQQYPTKPIASPPDDPTPRPTPVPTNLPTVSKIKLKTSFSLITYVFVFQWTNKTTNVYFLSCSNFIQFDFFVCSYCFPKKINRINSSLIQLHYPHCHPPMDRQEIPLLTLLLGRQLYLRRLLVQHRLQIHRINPLPTQVLLRVKNQLPNQAQNQLPNQA
jgi:hypothetical protein